MANVLYSLQTGLESDDLSVVTAKTGKRGLALVPKENPDVVIVDVRLPDMSGLEVFDKIKELAPKVPVVIITAFAATETAIEAMKRGAFEYLLKPVDRSVARLGMVMGLIGAGIKTFARLFYYTPLILLSGATYLTVIEPQLPALSLLFIRLNNQGAAIALIFFGFETLLNKSQQDVLNPED